MADSKEKKNTGELIINKQQAIVHVVGLAFVSYYILLGVVIFSIPNAAIVYMKMLSFTGLVPQIMLMFTAILSLLLYLGAAALTTRIMKGMISFKFEPKKKEKKDKASKKEKEDLF